MNQSPKVNCRETVSTGRREDETIYEDSSESKWRYGIEEQVKQAQGEVRGAQAGVQV